MLPIINLVSSWLPIFNNYLIYIFALICVIACIKLITYIVMR